MSDITTTTTSVWTNSTRPPVQCMLLHETTTRCEEQKEAKGRLVFIKTGKSAADRPRRRPAAGFGSVVHLCAHMFTLREPVHLPDCVFLLKQQFQGPGEPARKTCRLPRGPAGSPVTPTQTPAVKHISLAGCRLYFPAFCPVGVLSLRLVGVPRAPLLLQLSVSVSAPSCLLSQASTGRLR